jgi:hypothetical protein
MVRVLSRATTLHTLLEEYPFLREHLRGLHPVFARLARPGPPGPWERVATLGELATTMDRPWPELLRDLQEEVRRVTGSAPPTLSDPDERGSRLAGDLRSLLKQLEDGASLESVAQRLDAETRGLDAESVAALAHAADRRDALVDQDPGGPASVQADWPPARLSLPPGHPVRSLLDEIARLGDLVTHIDQVVDGLAPTVTPSRWRQARPVLKGLLERLGLLDHQRRRLRMAWRATLASRGGQTVTAYVDGAVETACSAVRQARVDVEGGDAAVALAAVRVAVRDVRAALVAEEELLVPAALRWLDADDWEAVAEMERLIGPAIAADQSV